MKNLNVKNLTSLWQLAGECMEGYFQIGELNTSVVSGSQWPNRLWLNRTLQINDLGFIKELVKDSREALKVSIFHDVEKELEEQLVRDGFVLSSIQTGMCLNLNGISGVRELSSVELRLVDSKETASLWSKLFFESFGYSISKETIEVLMPYVSFYLLLHDNVLAGTVLEYRSEEVVGIHSLGVVPGMRKKGIARAAMKELVLLARKSGGRSVVLQASAAAVGLYRSLGFQEEFTMRNYQIK